MIIFILAFIGAITPGPDILLVLQTTLRFGIKRAIITLCGIASGWIIYMAILGAGLAHFIQSNLAQMLLSAFGAIYLIYVSLALFKKPKNEQIENLARDSEILDSEIADSNNLDSDNLDSNTAPLWKSYLKGLFVNLSNPKAIIFMSAVVAPFLNRGIFLNFVILFFGLLSAFVVIIVLGVFARRFINARFFDLIDKICAILFFIFAILLLFRSYELAQIREFL